MRSMSNQRGQCIGFIAGIVFEASGASFCMPRGVTYQQTARAVIAYIEARPQRMHESFGLLAHEALETAWPCKRWSTSSAAAGDVPLLALLPSQQSNFSRHRAWR